MPRTRGGREFGVGVAAGEPAVARALPEEKEAPLALPEAA